MSSCGQSGISSRQRRALALAAGLSPVFRVCAGISWPWVLTGGLAAMGLVLLLARRTDWAVLPAALGGSLPGSLAAVLGALALLHLGLNAGLRSRTAFPETADSPAAAALLLGLAAAVAMGGAAVPGRCAAILLGITGVLFGIVLLGSLPQLELRNLKPAGAPKDSLRALGALTVPAAALLLPSQRGEAQPSPPGTALGVSGALLGSAAAASLVTVGCMTAALAAEPMAFLTLARSASVLGVMQRFEALVSGALLLSDFCLCLLLLTAAAELLRNAGRPAETDFVPVLAVLPVLALADLPDRVNLILLTAICGGMMATMAQHVVNQKKFGKNEKKC